MKHVSPGELAEAPAAPAGALYRSSKSYGHEEGLSCCFRQWRAASHCNLLHGYALAFSFVFVTDRLDERNWCYDFGGLKPVKAWLHQMFDHTTLVAEDDPQLPMFRAMAEAGLVDLRVLPSVGCEAVARLAFDHVDAFVAAETGGRVRLESASVREHAGNGASYGR